MLLTQCFDPIPWSQSKYTEMDNGSDQDMEMRIKWSNLQNQQTIELWLWPNSPCYHCIAVVVIMGTYTSCLVVYVVQEHNINGIIWDVRRCNKLYWCGNWVTSSALSRPALAVWRWAQTGTRTDGQWCSGAAEYEYCEVVMTLRMPIFWQITTYNTDRQWLKYANPTTARLASS